MGGGRAGGLFKYKRNISGDLERRGSDVDGALFSGAAGQNI